MSDMGLYYDRNKPDEDDEVIYNLCEDIRVLKEDVFTLRAKVAEFECRPEWLAVGDGTLHGAIDHWAERATKAEAKLAELEAGSERVQGVCISESGWPALVPIGSEDIDGRKPLYTTPQPVKGGVPNANRLFELGWRLAAEWADRDDLIADIDSPAYINDRDVMMARVG